MKTKLHICYNCVEGIDSAHACSLAGVPVFMSLHDPRLVDSVDLLVVSMTPPAGSLLPLIVKQDT